MYNLFRALVGDGSPPQQASVSTLSPSRASSLDNLFSAHSSNHMGTGNSSDDITPQQEDLAVLWEAKWFGCSPSGASAWDASSRQNGSQGSNTSRCLDPSEHHRGSRPIIFSSRTEEVPPCVTRQRNTPLAPNRLQSSGSMGLGTWTTRQTTFLEGVPEHAAAVTSGQAGRGGEAPATPGSLVAAWLRQQAAQQQLAQGAETNRLQSEDAVEDAAWRWRFARRWHAEQTRDIDPGSISASDKVDDSRYLGWNMQQHPVKPEGNVARTASSDLESSLVKNGSIVGVDLLLFDTDGGWAVSRGDRDRSLAQQHSSRAEREQRALRLWDAPGSMDASLLPPVEIDGWGAFRFQLLKLCDGLGCKERLLVHGHNHCTDASLVEDINRKVMQVTGLQGGAGTLLALGGGIMEWRRDRERCLHLHSGFILNTTHKAFAAPGDVLNLAAELVRDSLPHGYVVVVGDGRG